MVYVFTVSSDLPSGTKSHSFALVSTVDGDTFVNSAQRIDDLRVGAGTRHAVLRRVLPRRDADDATSWPMAGNDSFPGQSGLEAHVIDELPGRNTSPRRGFGADLDTVENRSYFGHYPYVRLRHDTERTASSLANEGRI